MFPLLCASQEVDNYGLSWGECDTCLSCNTSVFATQRCCGQHNGQLVSNTKDGHYVQCWMRSKASDRALALLANSEVDRLQYS